MSKKLGRFSPVLTSNLNPRTGNIIPSMKRSKKGNWVHKDAANAKIDGLEARIKELEKVFKCLSENISLRDLKRHNAVEPFFKAVELLKGGK